CVQTWRMGEEGAVSIANQQVGVTWPSGRSDGLVISVDLDGNLNYLQEGNDKPVRVVHGHQKAITAAGYTPKDKTLWTGSYDGRVRAWDLSTAEGRNVDGESPKNYVSGFAPSHSDGRIYSVSWDDTLRTIDASTRSFIGSSSKTDGQPKSVTVAASGSKPVTLVATNSAITLYNEGEQIGSLAISFTPTSIAAKDDIVAVGAEDKVVRIYTLSGNSLSATAEIRDATAAISTLAFSPSSSCRLAVGLSNGKIYVYTSSSPSEWALTTNRWSAHTARVTCITWSPDGEKAASGGLDTNVFVWSLADPGKRVKAMNAHKDGVGGIAWTEPTKIISCGADAAVKVWKVENVQ
ncbi:tricorn protease domain 2-containing protein, partial [Aureobasidium melanogenum]